MEPTSVGPRPREWKTSDVADEVEDGETLLVNERRWMGEIKLQGRMGDLEMRKRKSTTEITKQQRHIIASDCSFELNR